MLNENFETQEEQAEIRIEMEATKCKDCGSECNKDYCDNCESNHQKLHPVSWKEFTGLFCGATAGFFLSNSIPIATSAGMLTTLMLNKLRKWL